MAGFEQVSFRIALHTGFSETPLKISVSILCSFEGA